MKNVLPDAAWPLTIMVVVFFVSGQTEVAAPSFDISIDKVAHLGVFGMLATSIVRIPFFRKRGWSGAMAAVLLASLYGVLDEARQSFTPGRSVEVMDMVADGLGAVIGAVLYQGSSAYRKVLEWPNATSA